MIESEMVLALLVLLAAFLAGWLWFNSQVMQRLADSVPPEHARQMQDAFIKLLFEAAQKTETTIDDDQVAELADQWQIELDDELDDELDAKLAESDIP